MSKLKWIALLVLLTIFSPMVNAKSYSFSECRKLLTGTYLVPEKFSTVPMIAGLAKELINPEYSVGQPAFRLRPMKKGLRGLGLVSGVRYDLDVYPSQSQQSIGSMINILFIEKSSVCTALMDTHRNIGIYWINTGALIDNDWLKVKTFMDQLWKTDVDIDTLKNINYYYVYEYEAIGVTSVPIMIPLMKIEEE